MKRLNKAESEQALNLVLRIPLTIHPAEIGKACLCSECSLARDVKRFLKQTKKTTPKSDSKELLP